MTSKVRNVNKISTGILKKTTSPSAVIFINILTNSHKVVDFTYPPTTVCEKISNYTVGTKYNRYMNLVCQALHVHVLADLVIDYLLPRALKTNGTMWSMVREEMLHCNMVEW